MEAFLLPDDADDRVSGDPGWGEGYGCGSLSGSINVKLPDDGDDRVSRNR